MGLAVLSLLPGNALKAADARNVQEPGDVDPPSATLLLSGTGPEGKDHLRAVHLAKQAHRGEGFFLPILQMWR